MLISVRDILSWARFITSVLQAGQSAPVPDVERVRPWEAFVHGVALVLLDGLGLGSGLSPASAARLRLECTAVLARQVRDSFHLVPCRVQP